MVGQCASKAEHMRAIAVNSRHDFVQVLALYTALYSVFAVRRRTPLEVLFVVDVRSCEEGVISVNVSKHDQPTLICNSYLSWSSDETKRSRDFESTIRVQPSPGHLILAASPSS